MRLRARRPLETVKKEETMWNKVNVDQSADRHEAREIRELWRQA